MKPKQPPCRNYTLKLVYLIDSDCCVIYCSTAELIERVNSPKAILTARGGEMCEPEPRWLHRF